jgi:hypothetical protein
MRGRVGKVKIAMTSTKTTSKLKTTLSVLLKRPPFWADKNQRAWLYCNATLDFVHIPKTLLAEGFGI